MKCIDDQIDQKNVNNFLEYAACLNLFNNLHINIVRLDYLTAIDSA